MHVSRRDEERVCGEKDNNGVAREKRHKKGYLDLVKDLREIGATVENANNRG